jgi:hypothetical protein
MQKEKEEYIETSKVCVIASLTNISPIDHYLSLQQSYCSFQRINVI